MKRVWDKGLKIIKILRAVLRLAHIWGHFDIDSSDWRWTYHRAEIARIENNVTHIYYRAFLIIFSVFLKISRFICHIFNPFLNDNRLTITVIMLLLVMVAALGLGAQVTHVTSSSVETRLTTESWGPDNQWPMVAETLLPHSTSRENIGFFQTLPAKIWFNV